MRKRSPSFDGIHALQLNDGVTLQGIDDNIYVVKNKKWEIFEEVQYDLLRGPNGVTQLISRPFELDIVGQKWLDGPEIIKRMLPIQGSQNDVDDKIVRTKGRPRKNNVVTRTRPANKYNIFISEAMKILNEELPNLSNQEKMKECAKRWQQSRIQN